MTAGVGPESTEYRAVCVYTGPTPDGAQCDVPATTHVLVFTERYGATTLASCAGHRAIALKAGRVLDEHAHQGFCGLPGTLWVKRPESRCVIDDSGVEPTLIGANVLDGAR